MSKMTCEDCIHSEVCCSYLIADEDFEITSPEKMANSCDDFADRSRFVELPSDGVMYGVLNGKPIELSNFISPPKGNELFILSPETINVPFYKTREEAEQELRERESIE